MGVGGDTTQRIILRITEFNTLRQQILYNVPYSQILKNRECYRKITRAGVVAQCYVKHLPSMCEALVQSPAPHTKKIIYICVLKSSDLSDRQRTKHMS
jgi:hypothetical protein